MKLISKTPLIGHLRVFKTYQDGSKVLHFEDDNVITLPSKQVILSSVYASSLTPDPVSTLKVGIGGTIDPEGLYPRPVTQNLTGLYNVLTTLTTTHTIDSTVPSVTYLADLDNSTGAGQKISEAGLFKSSGLMFNIKTFPAIPKTSEFGVHFEWVIKIV